MKLKSFAGCLALAVAALLAATANAEGKSKQKWLVLDPITYSRGVNATTFSGIDGLLLTKLADAHKYRVMDRDAYKTASREANIDGEDPTLKGAGYSVRGEVVDTKRTGATLRQGQQVLNEYVVSVSLRVNSLKGAQEAYIGKTVRVQEYVVSEKDMLMYVIDELAREILFKEFPLRVVKVDGQNLVLNYGEGFVASGAQYEVGTLEMEEDPDTGIEEPVFTRTGACQITDVYERKANAVLTVGKAEKRYVLQRTRASAKAQAAAGVVASSTGDLAAPGAVAAAQKASGRYSCVVGSFGFAADFHAYRYVPDASVTAKVIGGALGILGSRNKSNATAGAVGNLLSDNSNNQEFRVRVSNNEWRSIAERGFAAYPAKFDVHAGVNPNRALQDGIQYAVSGTVSQLYEKDGQCTVSFALSLTDLQQNGSVVFSKDVVVTVPSPYQGQSTFATAVSMAVGQFSTQLQ